MVGLSQCSKLSVVADIRNEVKLLTNSNSSLISTTKTIGPEYLLMSSGGPLVCNWRDPVIKEQRISSITKEHYEINNESSASCNLVLMPHTSPTDTSIRKM
jgi:hypothetical protein